MSDEPPADNRVKIDNAETVNVPGDLAAHPAVIWIVGFVTVGVLLGFGWVTYAVLDASADAIDAATRGAVIQTWNNLAVAAAAVWTTSSVVNRLKGSR